MTEKIDMNNLHQYTIEYELNKLVHEMNNTYALTVINGAAKIVQRITQQDRSDTFTYMNVQAFKQLFSNTRIQTGVNTQTTYAEAWLNHQDRLTYPFGITYAPYRNTPKGMLNTWCNKAIEHKQV